MQNSIVVINASCHQGTGWKRWQSIRGEVMQRLPSDCKEVVLENGVTLKDGLKPWLQKNEQTLIISAGGDGTVHYLINYLLKEEKENIRDFTLGAIGLGSSNDFLKPFGEKIKGIPVRINRNKGTVLHDAGIATYLDDANLKQKKYFVVNASVGVTAEANRNFNYPGRFLQFLKKQASGAAIFYTAVRTILAHRNQPLSLVFNGQALDTAISNINILKIPFVSGSFFYKQPVFPDDGQLALNICMNMSKRELLAVLNQLQKGNFAPGEKTLTAFAKGIDIICDKIFVFECDGETENTRSLNITVLPKAITILKNEQC